MLRIHAGEENLDVKWARQLLGFREDDPLIARLYEDEEHGVMGCYFRGDRPFKLLNEKARWLQPVFRNAAEWLQQRSIDQFKRLRAGGHTIDILIGEYSLGTIPPDFLKEVVRLEMPIVLTPPPERAPPSGR